MKLTLLIISFFSLFILGIYLSGEPNPEPDEATKQLCREYADRDHEMELAPERWQMFKEQGIDPNTDFDWYQSCLAHNSGAEPAKGMNEMAF